MTPALPAELLLRIFDLALRDAPRRPISLLLANSYFHKLCLSLLHSALRFLSIRQLECFVRTCTLLVNHPRVIFIGLAGGTADSRLFKLLRELFIRIAELIRKSGLETEHDHGNHSEHGRLGFRSMQLCLNSLRFDENSEYLFKALDVTDPQEFIWTGPDPAHHFSIAIVPVAASYLFRAMQSWTSLRHLKLTNLSFPLPDDGYPTHMLAKALGISHTGSRESAPDYGDEQIVLPARSSPMPHLQTIYLGQITFLDPLEIVLIASATELASLTALRLVDTYRSSIWGPRIRITDVEKAASSLHANQASDTDADSLQGNQLGICIERIRKLVSCEALTERIMGGDRMDPSAK